LATAAQLVDQIVAATGLAGEDVRQRARRLRELGMLPTGRKGRGAPHIDARHAVTLLFSALAGGPVSRAGELPTSLWRLQWTHTTVERPTNQQAGATLIEHKLIAQRGSSTPQSVMAFGDQVVWGVLECRFAYRRAHLASVVRQLSVWQDGHIAEISFADGGRLWYGPVAEPNALAAPVNIARVSTMATVPFAIIPILSDLVIDSERQAGPQSISGPSAEGGEPPTPAAQPVSPQASQIVGFDQHRRDKHEPRAIRAL
jgi:hypothetical protein